MRRTTRHIHRRARRNRRGQSLVEFAVVAIALYLLLAAILTFGHMLFCAQTVQQTADVAARELAHTPLPADSGYTLEYVLYEGNPNSDPAIEDFRRRVFDPHYLVIDLDNLGGRTLWEYVDELPAVNQQLFPLLVYNEAEGRRLLHYPGALMEDPDTSDNPADPPPGGYLIAVPVERSAAMSPGPPYELLPVIEEIESTTSPDPFTVTSPARGLVALRINLPYQSPTMSGFHEREDPFAPPTPDDPVLPVEVTDPPSLSLPGYGAPVDSDREYGPYTGRYGLGKHAAWAGDVRPFSRVIAAQAIYRREVFQ
jgi:hypothetical protein